MTKLTLRANITYGQRVLNAQGPTMEVNISAKGMGFKSAKFCLEYRPSSQGVLHGEEQGVLMSGEWEMATL